MPKLRPQSFPVTNKGMRMARRATTRNRGQVAARRNAQLPEMDLQRTIDSTMPNLKNSSGRPRSPQSSSPLTSTTNPQNILSSGFQTSFASNPIKSINPNNETPGTPIGHNGGGGGDDWDPNVGRGYTKPQGAKGQYSRLK